MAEFWADDVQAICDFLDERWDPIGVYNDPADAWPPGEYHEYAGPLFRALTEDADRTRILAQLLDARQRMGLDEASGREHDEEVAEDLLQWWHERQSRRLDQPRP